MQRWNLIHLARRDKFRFGGKMHETTLLAAPMERVGQLQAFMWHLGDSVYAERLRKNTTYMEILVEELLRRNEKIHWHDLLIRPIADFFKNYVVRQGWRDGVLGLIWALHCTSGLVRILLLVWDAQNRIPREVLEARCKQIWERHSLGETLCPVAATKRSLT